MDAIKLYYLLTKKSQLLFKITNPLEKFLVGRVFNWIFIPFFNYRSIEVFKNKPDEFIIEYGIHDTFDALSAAYDKPMKAKKMKQIAEKHLNKSI